MWKPCLKLCWLLAIAILILGNVASAQGAGSRFSRFAGLWVAHSASLRFSQNGWATFNERTYRWCGHGEVSPCDSIDAHGVIRPGYQEHIHFSSVAGSVAFGTIVASNLHPPGLAVAVELLPMDTLLYKSRRTIALLCGPAAPAGMCGA